MGLDDIATIVVSSTGAGVIRAGYGVANILSPSASWIERYRRYTSIGGVGSDWAVNTPEYMAAAKIFSQSPRVREIKISRAANKPTQQVTLGVVSALQNADYRVRVAIATGIVFPSQDASYNSAGATGWVPSNLWSRGDLVVASDGTSLFSCLGPSGAGMSAGFTGYGGASGPTGASAAFRENGVYWMFAGTGGTGALTNDAIMNGLKSRIEALGAPTAVGTGTNQLAAALAGGAGSRTLTLTAQAAAKFFALQVYDRGALTAAQTHADPGVAADLAAINLATKAWYGLITLYNSSALVTAAAAWVETSKKLYAAATIDTKAATDSEGSSATDVAHALKAGSYFRTWAFFHPSPDQFADAAELGKFFPFPPGSETWRMKTLAGVTVEAYSETETGNLKDKNAQFFYDIGGVGVVGGDAKSAAGEYIDKVRGLDWYESELQAKLANLEIAVPKIPFTNPGIDSVESKVREQNKAGINAGLIRAGTDVVTAPDVADVSTEDKLDRELSGVTSTFDLAGAVHHITVTVTAND